MSEFPEQQVRFIPRDIKASRVAADMAKRRHAAERKRKATEERTLELIHRIPITGKNASYNVTGWLRGEPDLVIPDEAVSNLRTLIEEEFSGRELAWATNFVAREFERGAQQHGWTVRPLPRVIRLAMPKSPMDPNAFARLEKADILRRHLLELLEDQENYLPDRLPALAMLCCVMFSAVLHQKKLLTMMQQIEDGLHMHENNVWVEWNNGTNWERVCLEPVSACLMIRLHAAIKEGLVDIKVFGSKSSAVATLRTILPSDLDRLSLDQLIRIARADWVYHLPPFLYHWAIGQQPSTVLPPDAWFRMFTRQQLLDPSKPESESEDAKRLPYTITPDEDKLSDHIWTDKYRNCLTIATKRETKLTPPKVVGELVKIQFAFDKRSLPYLIGGWLNELIISKRKKGQGLEVSSARTMLCYIDRRLHIAAGNRLPADLDRDGEWSDILDAISQSVSPRHRNNVNHALQSFHSYLIRKHGFTDLEDKLTSGADARVDANLITEHEFSFIPQRLGQRLVLHHARYCHIAALLGFRGKLRRSETWGLFLSDWRDGKFPEILCQPNDLRKLKTPSSRRRILLDGHFTAAEIELIREHVREISELAELHNIAPEAMPLFPHIDGYLENNEAKTEPIKMELLIDPIEEAMRRITGDSSLRYHHLRHSGANNEMSLGLSKDIGNATCLTIAPSVNVRERSDKFTKALLNNGQARQSLLWGISGATGHASPDTTMASYLHLCDWWLCVSCSTRQPDLNDNAKACLADIKVSHLRVQRHRSGADKNDLSHLVSLVASKYPNVAKEDETSARFRPYPTSPPQAIARTSPKANPTLLPSQLLPFLSIMDYQANDDHTAILNSEAQKYGINASVLKAWHHQAKELSHLPSRNHNKILMRTVSDVHIWRTYQKPLLPKLEQEYMLADRLYEAILAIGRNNPDAMSAWLEEFVRHRIAEFNCTWLTAPDKASEWLNILDRIIASANTDIYIKSHERTFALIHHHPSKQSWLSAEEQQQFWPTPPESFCISDKPVTTKNNVRLAGGAPNYGAMAVWLAPPKQIQMSADKKTVELTPYPKRISSTALNAAVFTVLCTAGRGFL